MFFVINNKVFNDKVYIYNIKIYNNKLYTYLSLYVTVLPVECPSMITLIPPPQKYGSNIDKFQILYTEINHPKEC